MKTHLVRSLSVLALLLAGSLLSARSVYAHCDGLDGPVVEAGRQALKSGDVRHALIWVLPANEPEIRSAFEHAQEVRRLGQEARELADRYFFETLVRVHREGEGESYTGLKPAGRDLGPAIPAADRALATASTQELEALLTEAVRRGLRERFHPVEAAHDFGPTDVKAGRAYVRAYVPFLHYVEAIHKAAAGSTHEHGDAESAASAATHQAH